MRSRYAPREWCLRENSRRPCGIQVRAGSDLLTGGWSPAVGPRGASASETFFVLLERTPSERKHIQRTLKVLVYEAMAN
jgi:hypothetical protein